MARTKVLAGPLPRDFDGSKSCWCCDSKKMKPDERGYVCTKCGATWTKLPEKQGLFPFEKSFHGRHAGMAGSPTASLVKEVAKERAQKSPLT